MICSSDSVRLSRARWATQRTCSSGSAMECFVGLQGRHLERFALDWPLHHAAANRLDGDALGLDFAVDHDFDALQIRLKRSLGDAGHLAANAAQVFRLAAPRVMIALHRLFSRNGTLHSHCFSLASFR